MLKIGVVVLCPTARLCVPFLGAGGCVACVRWSGHHGSHGKDLEKAMRSMGPPHAYVCGLVINLLHYPIFLKSPCPDLSKCDELSWGKDLYIFG